MQLLISSVLLVLLARAVVPYGTGPPAFTPGDNPNSYTYCTDLTPGHGAALIDPANSPVTFNVTSQEAGELKGKFYR